MSSGPEFVPMVNMASRTSNGSHLLGDLTSLLLNRKEPALLRPWAREV